MFLSKIDTENANFILNFKLILQKKNPFINGLMI